MCTVSKAAAAALLIFGLTAGAAGAQTDRPPPDPAKLARDAQAAEEASRSNAGAAAASAAQSRTEAERAAAQAGQSARSAESAAGARRGAEEALAKITRPPPNRATLQVGARTMNGAYFGRKDIASLSQQLDGCLWPGLAEQDEAFACVAQTTRTAARSYRAITGDRQRVADSFTTGAAAGLVVAAAGVGHAANDAIRAWTIAGLLPVVADDLTQPGPRARLYNVAGMAMTVITVRAETLDEAKAGLAAVDDASFGWEETCGPDAIKALNDAQESLTAAKKADLAKEATKLNGVIEARCAELDTARYRLLSANALWSAQDFMLARGLAKDAVLFDDTIARLERLMRSGAQDVLKVAFKAPFNVVAKVVNGQVNPPEFSGRALGVFTEDFTFELTRLPDLPVPDPVAANLVSPTSLGQPWAGATRKINALTERLNIGVRNAQVFRAVNNQSILTLRPGSTNKPVSLAAPTGGG